MNSKTPNFDRALENYYQGLVLDKDGGEERTCRFSGEKFRVEPRDVDFSRKIGVPLHTLSWAERIRAKASYFNNYNLFRVKSAHSGKSIVAAYPPDTPYKIFEHSAWFSEALDPLAFGVSYDPSKSFFKQFAALQLAVPRPNLITDATNVNSEYTNTSTNLKNSYLTFSTLSGENLYYFDCCNGSRDCVDCESTWDSIDCYRCQLINNCHGCISCEESRNCIGSQFLFDCRDCSSCFMSANLRHKKYYFFNEPLEKAEYNARIKALNLGSEKQFSDLLQKFMELKRKAFRRPDNNFKSVNCVGDFIDNSKNCRTGYYLEGCENTDYSFGVGWYRDCSDIFGGGGGELCYEYAGISTRGNYGVKFSSQINQSHELEYCDLCYNCRNCFGCVGLKNKSFCVLNRQYSESEYWSVVDTIKTAMLKSGEYGEFFPPALMPVPYRISFTVAYDGFGDYENAERYGYDTRPVESLSARPEGEIIEAGELPDDIKNVNDSILQKAVHDSANGRYFKITPYELAFYRRRSLPLPRINPMERLADFRKRYTLRLKFFDRRCPVCGTGFTSVFDPKEYANVYCESCYNSEIV